MNIPLKTIDTDNVMPKKKDVTDDGTYAVIRRLGHNDCVSINDTLILDMDTEKMAEIINNEHKKDGYCARTEDIVKSLLSTPAVWMKIGVKK